MQNKKITSNIHTFKKNYKVLLFFPCLFPLQKPLAGLLRFHGLFLVCAKQCDWSWRRMASGCGGHTNKNKTHTLPAFAFTLAVFVPENLGNFRQSEGVEQFSPIKTDILFGAVTHYWEYSGEVPRQSSSIFYSFCVCACAWACVCVCVCVCVSEGSSKPAFQRSLDLTHLWV